ncbi:hypothetical protein ACQCT6_19800 [Cytobacillus gottheilii]|nr:hypothetical protein [Cytobacillus gottheilii]
MKIFNADIDQILDDTSDMADEDLSHLIRHIEIDLLLESTQDW